MTVRCGTHCDRRVLPMIRLRHSPPIFCGPGTAKIDAADMDPYRNSRFEHAHTLTRLWRHPGQSRESLERFRDRKLRFLVAHAYDRVAYYRQLFEKAGVRPADIRCAADLAQLAVSTKADFS
jgi:hypothetical protein